VIVRPGNEAYELLSFGLHEEFLPLFVEKLPRQVAAEVDGSAFSFSADNTKEMSLTKTLDGTSYKNNVESTDRRNVESMSPSERPIEKGTQNLGIGVSCPPNSSISKPNSKQHPLQSSR
jgi:hypothetical protein